MANMIGKVVSWAAREAEEYATKHGVSIQRAIEAIEEKYGQKIYSATAKPPVDEFATSAPSMFLGDANAPRNRSLREMVSPGVEESITAREASRYTEPGPLNRPVSRAGERSMLGVQESTIARDASKYREPGVAGQRQLQNVQESTVARDASKYNEPDLPPPKGTVMYSEGETNPLYLGKTPEARRSPSGKQIAGFTAGGALGTALLGDQYLGSQEQARQLEEAKNKKVLSKSQIEQANKSKESSPEVSFETSQPLAIPGLDVKGLSEAVKNLDKTPTSTIKKEAKKAVTATDDRAKEAQKAADKGEIPQVEADRFKEERDRAYKMYSEAKDRNEWLELAQLLGQAVTQYGAARVGMRTGRSMAGLQLPSVDYGARTAQEQRLLESRLRDIGEEQTREQRLADRLKEDKRDEDRLALERRRVELAEKEAAKPSTDTTEARQLRKEQREKQEQKQAAITNIMAGLANLKVGNKKQKEAASELIDKNISGAGLSREAINKISELKEGPGFFSGSWDKKRQEVESLLQSETPPATMEPAATVPTTRTVKIQAPDGSIAEVPAEKAQKYINKGGKIVQ